MNQYYICRDGIRLVAQPQEIQGVCQVCAFILVEKMGKDNFTIRLIGKSQPGYLVDQCTKDEAVAILAMVDKKAEAQGSLNTGFIFEADVNTVTQWVMQQ